MKETIQIGKYRAILEQDQDRWSARIPELEAQGVATWGYTRDEAVRNLEEVLEMVTEDLQEDATG